MPLLTEEGRGRTMRKQQQSHACCAESGACAVPRVSEQQPHLASLSTVGYRRWISFMHIHVIFDVSTYHRATVEVAAFCRKSCWTPSSLPGSALALADRPTNPSEGQHSATEVVSALTF